MFRSPDPSTSDISSAKPGQLHTRHTDFTVAPDDTIVIISGYFDPIHTGHLDLAQGAQDCGDKVCVIINNDAQQAAKKGRVITQDHKRLRIALSLACVDFGCISIDQDKTVIATLEHLAQLFPDNKLIFANGGDRTTGEQVPEVSVCQTHGIEMRFDVGGITKADSSTRLIREYDL